MLFASVTACLVVGRDRADSAVRTTAL